MSRRKPDLICFSHLRWDFVYQRPQHLLSRATAGFHVHFVEEPVFRTEAAPHLEGRLTPEGVTVLIPILPEAHRDTAEPQLERLILAYFANRPAPGRVLWYYTPQALDFSRRLDASVIVYDNMDELSGFLGAPRHLLDLEDELLGLCDLVFTGGISLYEAKRARHSAVHPFPSSVDAAHFGRARAELEEPVSQAHIPTPRIGFFGVIDERMDMMLVDEIARLRPDWHLVMIGPVVKIDPAACPQRANIHWLGSRSYKELPAYLARWDCGFMPFARNEATRFISPTKTPEFLAAGLRVASTPITDVVRTYGESGLVAIAEDAPSMVAALEDLLQSRTNRQGAARWARAVDDLLASMSWDRTWDQMLQHMNRVARTALAMPAE